MSTSSPSSAAPGADLTHLRDWIGRTESRSDLLTQHAAAAMAATLDLDTPAPVAGDALPPLWTWMHFQPLAPAREIGADGHPRRGGFLPPVPLPRRMWAGGRLQFHRPLRVGDTAVRRSTILDVAIKSGRSGTLVFVTVQHDYLDAQGLAIREEQDIVYRDAPQPGAPAPAAQPAPDNAQFERGIVPDPVLLFRYSALTFNGHRIHYDRSYTMDVEGYPGLVVHGPMIATMLMGLARSERPDQTVRSFSFKAVRPLFDIHPFSVCGRDEGGGQLALWARDHTGALAMQATAVMG